MTILTDLDCSNAEKVEMSFDFFAEGGFCLHHLCTFAITVKNVKSSPPSSKLSCRTSWTASSVASSVCSFQFSPLSDRRITISLSLPLREAKWGTSMMTGPRNLAPAGPSSRIRLAIASPSINGGGWISLSFFRYLDWKLTVKLN